MVKSKKVLSLSLCIVILVLTLMSSVASATSGSSNETSEVLVASWAIAKPDDISKAELVYELTPSDEGWAELNSKDEMLDACDIDDKSLSEMTTYQVIDAVLTFPLLCNLYAYDSYDIALEWLAKDSEAYQELLSRKDAKECLISISEASEDSDETPLRSNVIEIILSDPRLSGTVSASVDTISNEGLMALTTHYTYIWTFIQDEK